MAIPPSAFAWWNPSWRLRTKVTFNNAAQTENLVDFPVLVRLDSSRIDYSRTQDLAEDLRFVDANDATVLNHEIDVWDEAGTSYVWVRVPQINGGSVADFIYLYYGNPTAPDGQNPGATWEPAFTMVHHFRENAGPHFDSTTTNNDSIVIDVAVQGQDVPPAQIYRGDVFDPVSIDNIDVADSATLNVGPAESITTEAWIRTTPTGDFQFVVNKKNGSADWQLHIDAFNRADFWVYDGTELARAEGSVAVSDNAWHYLVGRWDRATSTAEVFVDGVSAGSATNGLVGDLSNAEPLVMGEEGDANRGFNFGGTLDEVRVAKTARSNDWIQAQYLSMTDAFAAYGSAEPQCCLGLTMTSATTGPNDLVTVTATSSFELAFDSVAGGGVRVFYDLAEDSGKTVDLAGGLNSHGSLFTDEIGSGGTNYRPSENDTFGGKAAVIEATPTRVRVRQEALYKSTINTILPGVKGSGDYTIYDGGKMALRWNRETTALIPYTFQQLQTVAHYQGAAPLNGWASFTEGAPMPPDGSGLDAYTLARIEVAGAPGARTDFLSILFQDWPAANVTQTSNDLATEKWENDWTDLDPGTIPADSSEVWNFLTYFKPTNFVDHNDPVVKSRRDDYRNPDTLTVTVGSGWTDPAENTAGADLFNESEAAYVLEMDPSSGLEFDIDGGLTTRFQPFFKIREWRSLSDPPSVTLEGMPLTNDVHFKADVKPFARPPFYRELLWHSTLEGVAAVTSPNVGSAGSVTGGVAPATAKYGGGLSVPADADSISFPTAGNFNPARGLLGFWMRPTYNSADGLPHDIAGFRVDANNGFYLEKPADNSLHFRIVTTDGVTAFTSDLVVNATNYSFQADDWVHIELSWDDAAGLSGQQTLEINEIEPAHTNPTVDYNSAFLSVGPNFYIGNINNGAPAFSPAVYDEVEVARVVPVIGSGGAGSPDYLTDPAQNFTLNFTAVDADRRGRYLYFASDAKFRGLNVALATLGSGVAPGALEWEYRTATGWSNLEAVAGFTDETSSFTRSGTVYWTADPPGWSLFSRFGGVDLYTIRVHLALGASYGGNFPIESMIKTDILLFQYCGDVTQDGQTFVFAQPPPTAVRLASFSARGLDGAAELSWTTASELDNLGFHLYRGEREEGPYVRITATLIPGLGSSPVGASYAYRDNGLLNGREYFYKLEDVETGGKTNLHGPVSAVPAAGGSSSSESSSGSSAELTYGDPGKTSFSVVERSPTGVVLELTTSGFRAEPQADGSVRIVIPGFSDESAPGTPAIPVKRSWVEVLEGRDVRLSSVRAEEVEVLSLRPAAAGAPEIVASRAGTVLAGRRRQREGTAYRGAGFYPEEPARLLTVGYQGETKKALIELAPLRWDRERQALILARRLSVRLVFSGRERPGHQEGGSHRTGAGVLRLVAKESGLYGVRFEELGLRRRGVAASSLRLSRHGEAVAFHLEPDKDVFGRGSSLYFVSEGEKLNPYDRQAVYELELTGEGMRMPVGSASPFGPAVLLYRRKIEREENRYYQAGLLEANDLWQWDLLLAPAEKSYPLVVSKLAADGEPARLSLWLQGVSDFVESPDHHLRVKVNGVAVAESFLEGKKPLELAAEVPVGALKEGENEISIENVGDTGASYSMVMLDRFALDYPRALVAEGGRLEGSFAEAGVAEVAGLAPALVLDVTERTSRWLEGSEATATGALRFQAEPGRSYLAVSRAGVLKPEILQPPVSFLKDRRNRADYLVVGPRELLAAATPLLRLRRSQGLASRAVSIEEVYSEFGYGESRPEAVREFLSYAYHHWQKPSPRYVLLLGDASYDFKDYLGTGVKNQVPPLLVKTSYLWTASDPAYAAVNGEDILPDLALGRLPAANTVEVRAMVEKILAYESSSLAGAGPAVLVADNPDAAGDFEADAEEIAVGILSNQSPIRVYLGRLGSEATRRGIVDAFDRGATLLSYLGHGGIHLWANENVFNTSEVASLAPQPEQPLVLTLNCLNGYFHFPYFNSLAEELLKAEGKGAIAAFSPSGLSLNDPAHLFHKALLGELLSGKHQRLGDAVAQAQAVYAESGAFPELLQTYHLLGDPALKLRPR